jgi:nuclear pore complex protein Nup155
LNTYAEQTEVISHVSLVKPKPGIFIEDIHHLLVVCTPSSVFLLGIQDVPAVTSSGRRRKDLKVYATGMSVPTEVQMTSVIGTAEGRIFMAGTQDGHLYELHYQEKEGWFGKRIQLINHSVGGVSSLLPRLSAPAASGTFNPITLAHVY